MRSIRILSLILAVVLVFGLASLAFAQTGTATATATSAAGTAAAGATATRVAAPGTLPTTGGMTTTWMLPLLAFVVLFLVAGLGMNLARRVR